jgi:5-methylcytosine-specific restriction endonuclease McrA
MPYKGYKDIEKRKEYLRDWHRTPLGKAKGRNKEAKRRCVKLGNIVATDKIELNNIRKLYRVMAYANHFIGEHTYEVDHIVPIAKGGSHTLDNLQIITAQENRSKNDKII